jgi:hypothetical protein
MTFTEFAAIVETQPDAVVLLEGRRAIPVNDASAARHIASHLARTFPELRFRSGNAEGSDYAFSEGVASVDPSRLQIVAPYSSHRRGFRFSEAVYDSPESLTGLMEDEIAYKTGTASPKNRGLILKRGQKGALAAKAAYLLRDTMKVTGHSEAFPQPVCALFYVSLDDPLAGGTGHTIRVCQQEGVPYAFQDTWREWIGL